MQIRLDKFLADAGMGTRSEVKNIIKKKTVTINGQPANSPQTKVNSETDIVAVNGEKINLHGTVTYLLHKPAGYVCAVKDDRFPTVMELVPQGRDLFPVGRLDKDTEGILLITNDGAMAHRMLSPRSHVDKTYLAVLDRSAEEADIDIFAEGVDVGDDKKTLPAKLVICDADTLAQENSSDTTLKELLSNNLSSDALTSDGLRPDTRLSEYLPAEYRTCLSSGQVALLTIHEGRYHQVKRMFHAVGKEVVYLKRLTFGEITLPVTLDKGECLHLIN